MARKPFAIGDLIWIKDRSRLNSEEELVLVRETPLDEDYDGNLHECVVIYNIYKATSHTYREKYFRSAYKYRMVKKDASGRPDFEQR